MSYVGDIRLGDTIDIKFCTVNTSGVPTTLAGTPVISAYPGNSTTQLTAGITLTVDFDGVTGMHNVRVVASSGNGYATATNYALVITTGTVGGSSVVGYVVGEFSIEARSALMPTTAARTLDVSAGGEAGLDWANIGSPTTAVNLSATNIDVDQVVASVSGNVAGSVGSVTAAVSANVTQISGDATAADNAESFFDGTGYAGTNNVIPTVTTVNGLAANTITATAIASNAITAAKIATDAIGAVQLAADAVTEIAGGVWNSDATTYQTQGTFGQAIGDPGVDTDTIWGLANTNLDAAVSSRLATAGYTAPLDAAGTRSAVGLASANLDTQLSGIQADTDNIQTRIPAALVSGRIDASVGAYQSGLTPLQPTVAGRTLDVSTTGEAGIDWANIGSPTTAVNLSGTNIDVDQVVASVSGAVGSVTGNVSGSVGSVATGGITAASIATNAIDADAIAADAITEIQAGLATPTNITAGTITTVTNLTNLPTIPANWLTAAGLAADAVAEIADGVWDEATSGHVTSGTFGQALNIVRANTAQAGAAGTITLDASASATDDFYNNTLIFLTGGTGVGQARMISDYVGSTRVATVNGNWVTTPSSDSVFVILPFGAIPGASAPTVQQIVDGVWDEPIASHLDSGSTGEALNAAGGAGDPWITSLPGSYTAGQAGYIVGTNLNATVSSRLAPTVASRTLDVTANGNAGIDWANVDNPTTAVNLSGTNIDTDQIVASVTSGVTVTTNNDKTGYALSSAGVQAVWDALTSALTTAGSVGKLLADNLNATVGSRATQTSVDNVQADTDNIQTRLPVALDGGNMPSVVKTMDADTITASALAASAVSEIQSGLSTLTAAQVWDLSNGVESGLTPRQAMRLMAAALAGKLSGAATVTVTIRNAVADDANRIVATVDADGNRTAITYNLS